MSTADAEPAEHHKALLIWRLRRDLESFKELCLQYERHGIDKADLRKFLIELNVYYEELRSRFVREDTDTPP